MRLWSGDPSKYVALTRAERRRLAFGATDTGHRTRAAQDEPWEDLPGVEVVDRLVDGPDGRRRWLILPDEAAAAIRAATEDEGAELPNQ